jgi:cyclase
MNTINKAICFLCLFLLSLTQLHAQERDFSEIQITSEKITDNIYMLQGSGGNIGVFVGDDGVFMIDDQFAPLTEKILAAIKKISSMPVQYLVNTHWHGDHTGGNENLGKQGVLIAAHDNVYKRMSTEQGGGDRIVPPSPKIAQPVITFDKDMTFNINGEEITMTHVSDAHTDGDSLVHFNKANVIHAGDTFFAGAYPFIDNNSGGTIDGIISAAETLLEMADNNTRIIPGHGPVSSKKDLRAYYKVLVTARDRISRLKRDGKTLDDVKAAKPMADYDDTLGKGFINPETFLTLVYNTIK